MKNICILYYDGFYETEIVCAAAILKNENIFSVAMDDRVYVSAEKQKYLPDKTIKDLAPEEVDLFIIPGGTPTALYDEPLFKAFVTELNNRGKYIAGVCGGTFLMADCGLLEGKRCTGAGSGLKTDADYIVLFEKSIITKEDVVVDGNIVTSTAQAFIEFAIELGKVMGYYSNDEESSNDYKWFKNIKS